MLLCFLGTASGTEPMPDRRHSSTVLEVGGDLYWLDAGEACAVTAHLAGLDLLQTKKILISHPHMDHVGGLANLLWYIRKLSIVKKEEPRGFDLWVPIPEVADAVFALLRHTEGDFRISFPIGTKQVKEGELFREEVAVSALPNAHMPPREDGTPRSYSYLIEAEGRRIVYSGDVKRYEELDPLIGDGVDALLIETGHFGLDTAIAYLRDRPVRRAFFTHNGREVLASREKAKEKLFLHLGDRAVLCEDGMTVEV